MATNRKTSVHVVDDEAVIAWTLAAILESHGFQAVSFTDPYQSLEEAAKAAPHVLISDVVMPGMSGIEFAVRMKTLCPECKVLLFSGQASTANLLSQADAGGHIFEILKKPIHPEELLAAVRGAIADIGPAKRGD